MIASVAYAERLMTENTVLVAASATDGYTADALDFSLKKLRRTISTSYATTAMSARAFESECKDWSADYVHMEVVQ